VHPELGLGGAERLVVDAAVWLREAGHSVTVFTTHHDRSRCFESTRDGTLKVEVHGDFLRTRKLSRLRVPLAILRMSVLARALRRRRGDFDLVFCDLIAHVVPVLRAAIQKPIVFYCHFPDFLLTPPRFGLYRLYRLPIDWLEAFGMSRADLVLANSLFTRKKCEEAFPGKTISPKVLYPGVNHAFYEDVAPLKETPFIMLLSVNRFEGVKNLRLAVETLAKLREILAPCFFERLRLVMAGGFDSRLPEAAGTLQDLRQLAGRLGVLERMEFVPNPTDERRKELLADCRCLLYTPPYEHFGLVPLEAMAAGRPVIAVNQGGPLETVIDGRTGSLCPPTAKAFAAAVKRFVEDVDEAKSQGEAAREHVRSKFSRARFGRELEKTLQEAIREGAS
jgi:alpha-1,3/alpha-1,6-mannosyltransferase